MWNEDSLTLREQSENVAVILQFFLSRVKLVQNQRPLLFKGLLRHQQDCKKTCFYTIMAVNVMGVGKG